MFKVECAECGRTIEVEEQEGKGKCPHCGMVIVVVWPVAGQKIGATDYALYEPPEPKTITGMYEAAEVPEDDYPE